jgi:hypothetical protein
VTDRRAERDREQRERREAREDAERRHDQLKEAWRRRRANEEGGKKGRSEGEASGVIAATWDAINLVLALLFGVGFFYYYVAGVVDENHALSRASVLAFVVSLAAVVFLVGIHR